MPHCEAKLGVRGIAVLSEERIRNTKKKKSGKKLSFKRQEAKEIIFSLLMTAVIFIRFPPSGPTSTRITFPRH